MVNLRKAAKGQMCQIRILATAITIPKPLCWRITGWRGRAEPATKPHDMQAAIACSSCHDLIDGRVKTSDYTKEELRLMHAEGVFRTQEIWRKKGHL